MPKTIKTIRILAFIAAFIPPIAHAACTNPNGVEGEIIYNKAHQVPQYCDGTEWWGMGWKMGGGGGSTPSGAVMSFDLPACPNGWSEYEPARGRFIRGIDPTGTIDPSGTRTAGNIQADALQNITGSFALRATTNGYTVHYEPTGVFLNGGNASSAVQTTTSTTSVAGTVLTLDASRVARTSTETRPVNVALLYCRKD